MSVIPEIEIERPTGGLARIVERLDSLEAPPTMPDICGFLAEFDISDLDFAPFRSFSDDHYTRNRIFRNEFAELLVLGWVPGQESMIHDHDGSVGAVRVLEGSIREIKFVWDEDGKLIEGKSADAGTGMIAGVGEPDIHQLVCTTENGGPAVTLHLYAPPLEGLNIYDRGSREITFYLLS